MKKPLLALTRYLLLFMGLVVVSFLGIYFLAAVQSSCWPDMGKNKVAVIVAEGGIYDTEDVAAKVSEYYASVKKDLNIDSAGMVKFGGRSTSELDRFIEGLYLNNSVGYVILLGDDLPIIKDSAVEVLSINTSTDPPGGIATCLTNDSESGAVVLDVSADACMPGKFAGLANGVEQNFSCLGSSCLVSSGSSGYYRCRDIAVSYIVPPLLYSSSEKVDFVLKILSKYADYHSNFADYASKYQKSMLVIETDPADSGGSIGEPGKVMLGYDMPVVVLTHIQGDKISNELKNKHILLRIGVHGAPDSLVFGIGIPNQFSVSSDEYANFSKEYGTPALFVDAGSCNSLVLGHDDLRHCCWPQVFMESGTWAYYGIGTGGTEARFVHEKTIGLAVRKSAPTQVYIFGDILAHMG